MAYTICSGCSEIIFVPDELVGDWPKEDGYLDGVYYCDACEHLEYVRELHDELTDDDKPDPIPEWAIDPRRNGACNG